MTFWADDLTPEEYAELKETTTLLTKLGIKNLEGRVKALGLTVQADQEAFGEIHRGKKEAMLIPAKQTKK